MLSEDYLLHDLTQDVYNLILESLWEESRRLPCHHTMRDITDLCYNDICSYTQTTRIEDGASSLTRTTHMEVSTTVVEYTKMVPSQSSSGGRTRIMEVNSSRTRVQKYTNTCEAIQDNLRRQMEVSRTSAILQQDTESRCYKLEGGYLVLVQPSPETPDFRLLTTTPINVIGNYYSTVKQKKLDIFWLRTLLEQITYYFRSSWFDLTQQQRFILDKIVQNSSYYTVFNQLEWVGYDCLVRGENNHAKKIIEYNSQLSDFTDKPLKNTADLATDFALNFSYTQKVIDACDLHYQATSRPRMRYTKFARKY